MAALARAVCKTCHDARMDANHNDYEKEAKTPGS
jgi:hypothetical protein